MNTKRITIFVVLALLVGCIPAFAQTNGVARIWNNVDADSRTVKPQIQIFTSSPGSSKKIGFQTWTLVSEQWSESLIGMTLTPTKWASITMSLGMETDKDPLRGGADIWLGGNGYSVLFLQEYGGSGYWYRVIGTKDVSRAIKLGINGSRFFGWGPYVERSFGQVSFWATAPMIGIAHDEIALGLSLKFK